MKYEKFCPKNLHLEEKLNSLLCINITYFNF